MKSLAEMLSVGVVDKPVLDMTGLSGKYEVAIDISPEEAMNVARASVSFLPVGGGRIGGDAGKGPGVDASDPSGSSIFKSLQNLGLKLEPRKLPLVMLLIEHMERIPAAN